MNFLVVIMVVGIRLSTILILWSGCLIRRKNDENIVCYRSALFRGRFFNFLHHFRSGKYFCGIAGYADLSGAMSGGLRFASGLERAGADMVIAEGMESGGHIGEQTTMTLVPQVADAVSIPVVAAGGIADARGFCAAFMLGAEAVQMGTRFVVAKEPDVHQLYKDRIIAARDIDSVVTGRSTGHPVRSLRNEMTRQYLNMEKENVSFEELEHLTLGALRKAVVDGDVKMGTVMAGQIAGMVKKEQTCKEIITEIMDDAHKVFNSVKF